MNEKAIDFSVVGSSTVIEFYKAAHDFCLMLEQHYRFDREYVILYFQRMLPFLYSSGSLLPECELYDWQDNERYVTEETWQDIYNALQNFFADNNSYYYWDKELQEPTETSMAENIADIYQDLKDFVYLYAKPSFYAKSNALYYVRKWYFERWGLLILLFLQNLHRQLSEQYYHNHDVE